jgi:hypothetical protein
MKGIIMKPLNKEQLVALIMENTTEYKKTHLMLKPVTEVREIAAPYLANEGTPAEQEPTPETAEPAPTPEKLPETPKPKELGETHKILIETLPLLPDFKDTASIVKSKDLLSKVSELHNIPPRKTGPIMTALKRKGYFKLVGKNSGQKIVTVQLLPPAIEFLGLAQKTGKGKKAQ